MLQISNIEQDTTQDYLTYNDMSMKVGHMFLIST